MARVHSVLKIPELLVMVLGFLSDADLARVSTTSTWISASALDLLWKDCSDPRPLFRILSPLNEVNSMCFVS